VSPTIAPTQEPEQRTTTVVADFVGAMVGRRGGSTPAPGPNAGAVRVLQDPEEGALGARAGGHCEASHVEIHPSMKSRLIWHCRGFKLHLARLYKLDQIKPSYPCLKPPLPHPLELVCSKSTTILLLLQSSRGSVYIYESIGFNIIYNLEHVPMLVP
jgi:hypothetical protein